MMESSNPSRRALGAVALGAVMAPVAATASEAAEPVAAENAKVVTRFLTEVVNGGRFELLDELWAQDLVWHAGALGDVHGMDRYRKGIEAARGPGGAFTDMHLVIKDIIASGDKVVVYFTNSGVNSGEWLGHPATGKFAVWEGIGIYQLAHRKIVRAWFVEDMLYQQRMLGNWTTPLPGDGSVSAPA